jgi:uncharacterized protein (TIGR02453 family)
MPAQFSAKTFQFIEKASRQKSLAWLDKNRSDYEAYLSEPLQHLARHLKSKLAPHAVGYHFPQKGIGRIKRSANRPSESGSPYKNWISYSASRPAQSRFERNPSLYFGIHPDDPDGDHVIVAGGLYMPSSQQLRRVRETIASSPAFTQELDRLFASKKFKDSFNTGKSGFSDERTSSRVPRGFDPHHERVDWLKLQAFFVWKPYKRREFFSASFPERLGTDWSQILRLNDLLDQAVSGKLHKRAPSKKKDATVLISRLEELDVVAREMDFE